MRKLRIVVVEDSITIRKRLCEILTSDPDIEVVGEAADGKRAIELCEALRPDVMTLDMVMPVMSGLTATEYIMAYRPTPILIVSASMNRGEVFKTYDALAAGAVDVLEKPSVHETDERWERRFIQTVKLIAKIKVITHVRGRMSGIDPSVAAETERLVPTSRGNGAWAPHKLDVVAIGASTGGPAAIVSVLKALPPKSQAAILLVLHIDEPFSASFVDWLDSQTAHRVIYAKDRTPIESLRGTVVMSPPGQHLVTEQRLVRLSSAPARHSCRPSVDVLFESLARSVGHDVLACLLTGMGRDGAEGLLAIRNAGGYTIAQDEASSVVYGMPREAARLGAAHCILGIDKIGAEIGRRLTAVGVRT